MADETTNRHAFAIQQHYCEEMGAPVTARVAGALGDALTRDTATGRRVLDWASDPTADALPLRLVGGLHALAQAGASPPLSAVFAGEVSDPVEVETRLREEMAAHDDALLPWLDGPPQTNEAGRSSALLVGLIAVARRFAMPLEVLEIGSSAGFNLLIDRFGFDFAGTHFGPEEAELTLTPDWRGAPPAPADLRFHSIRGVDVAPLDATDPEQARRLRGYVWADNPERLERKDRVIAMLRAKPVQLERGDAAEWLDARLAEPQPEGVARVLMHSVVWQYLGEARQAQIERAMVAAGARADARTPLAWVAMEPDRGAADMSVNVRTWPDGSPAHDIAKVQAHGRWIAPV